MNQNPPITTRAAAYRDRILNAPYEICVERARLVTESYRKTRGLHPAARAARALENILLNMSIFILPEERIAGNRTSKVIGTMLPVERGEMNVIMKMDLDNLLTRERQPYRCNPEDRKELLNSILPWWEGRTLRDIKHRLWKERDLAADPPRLSPRALFERSRAFGPDHLWKTFRAHTSGRERFLLETIRELQISNPWLVHNVFDVQGHLSVGHSRVLPLGLKAVHDRAAEILKTNPPEDKKQFLEAVKTCCAAARAFAGRFAALSVDMAGNEPDPVRRDELLQIAQHASRVPWLPPESFHEALQSLWFTQLAAVLSYGIGGILAIGRPDQYLLPYYAEDLRRGAVTRDAARELVEELLIKLSGNLIPLPSYAKDTASELGADAQAVTLGGLTPGGGDATNELSFLFLDAFINVRAMPNSVAVRLHAHTPAEFVQKVAETHHFTSGLALFNDAVVVKSQQNCGCAAEHARDYAVIGCVEPAPQHDAFACTSGNDVSLAAVLEMTLNNGRLLIMGRRLGPRTGDPREFRDFDNLWFAFHRQLRHTVRFIARCVNAKDEAFARAFPNPFISSTFESCVENATDMTAGGTAYNFASISGRGLATVADSLGALKRFVYDENRYTMDEMLDALASNFRGREKMRRFLWSNTPRYGADNPEADALAARVAALFCDEVARCKAWRPGCRFRPGFFSYGMHVHDGMLLGATPDGRRAGEPVSNSISPVNGAETAGPTGVFLSVARINHENVTNGGSLNMKFSPSLFSTEEGRGKFIAMLRAYFLAGGMHVQCNAVDNETLRDAQKNPDRHRGLVVRVSGYSACFTDLGKSIQDEIIARTEMRG